MNNQEDKDTIEFLQENGISIDKWRGGIRLIATVQFDDCDAVRILLNKEIEIGEWKKEVEFDNKLYVDFDEPTGFWGIFHEDTGFCSETFCGKEEADDCLKAKVPEPHPRLKEILDAVGLPKYWKVKVIEVEDAEDFNWSKTNSFGEGYSFTRSKAGEVLIETNVFHWNHKVVK